MDARLVNPPLFLLFKTARRRLSTALPLFTLPLGLILGFAHAQELIYTEVRASQPVVAAGTELSLEVVLLDAFSVPIAASESYDLVVEVYRDSSAGELLEIYNVSIAVGDTFVPLAIPAERSGTFSVVAVHPALISRGLFVQVYDPAGVTVRTPLTSLPVWPGLARAAPTVASTDGFKLVIVYPTNVTYRANEGDRVKLQLFLENDTGEPVQAPEDIEVTLETEGVLTPKRIVIPKGSFSTMAFLRSSQAGFVDVAYLGANPNVQLAESTVLEPIQFVYTGLHIDPGPKASLIQPATLTVQLFGADGKPVNAKADRKVTIKMTAGSRGNGVFKPVAETIIERGDFEGDVTLFPTWPGRINVRASSANVASVDSSVEVSLALIWICVALAGGVVGALVALISESPRTDSRTPVYMRALKRVFVGVVAGLLLYWAYLFGVLLPPSPILILLHPFTAFFVTLLGAFVGIGILTSLIRRFGLKV